MASKIGVHFPKLQYMKCPQNTKRTKESAKEPNKLRKENPWLSAINKFS